MTTKSNKSTSLKTTSIGVPIINLLLNTTFSKHTLLCWILTCPEKPQDRVKAIHETWGRQYDKLFICSQSKSSMSSVVGFRVSDQADSYMFKVNNGSTRKRCEICSKLVSLLLTLNILHTLF